MTPWKDKLVFKGGTSLTKAWEIIERFSEDIDLVMNWEALGFTGQMTNSQIKKLREKTAEFMATEFLTALDAILKDIGIDPNIIKLNIQPGGVADRDPQILQLHYQSVLEPDAYLPEKVIIEIGARSLMEPASERTIHSIIGKTIPGQVYSGEPFIVMTVDPKKTFLEKAFLLHEEFAKPVEKIRYDRMSRHHYDLERLMDTEFGLAAISDKALYQLIIQHRAKFTPVRGIDYNGHSPAVINFLPPDAVLPQWERDYGLMQGSMIYGPSPSFKVLLQRMEELRNRFRAMPG